MKRFISFSGGVESSTMCLLYGKGATAIWCDTGAEHAEMYDRIDKCEDYFKKLHKGDFSLIRIKESKYGIGLEKYIQKSKYMPSQQARFCTRIFKIEPIDLFLSSQGDCELMIGFNVDEEGRTGSMEAMQNVKYTYPLIDDGYTRADCEDLLNMHGMHPQFPVYMQRGGCRMCFFKSEKEYRALYHLNRKEFNEVMQFEEGIQDKRMKFYSIMGNGKSLRQLASECENELFSNEDIKEMYSVYKKQERSCGAFCHR